jgi:DNA transformation protein
VAVSPAARAFALELFDGLGAVSARAMMGGLTLYSGGQVFAIVTGEERIYLKAAGSLAAALAAEGAEQFAYARKDGATARMGYWSLPDAALDDPEAACGWARRALAAAG